MGKLSRFLVDQRRAVFIVMMLLSAVSLFLIPRVNVNTDMTKYLPASSPMKQGIDILSFFPESWQRWTDSSHPNQTTGQPEGNTQARRQDKLSGVALFFTVDNFPHPPELLCLLFDICVRKPRRTCNSRHLLTHPYILRY